MSSAGPPSSNAHSKPPSSPSTASCRESTRGSLCMPVHSRVHGYGLFSTQEIDRGTLILSEKPLVSIPAVDCNPASIWKAFQQLGPNEQRDWVALTYRLNQYQYLELVKQAGEETQVRECAMALTKFTANARDDCVTGNRILPRLGARLNHACEPNALWVVNLATGNIEVRALSTIAQGAEIFVSYINQAQSQPFRQAKLLEYKFGCNCHTCYDDSSATEELFAELQLIDAKIVHVKAFQVDRLQALIGLFSRRLELEGRSRCLTWDTVVSATALSDLYKQSGSPDRAAQFERVAREHLAVCYGEGFVMPDDMRQGILRGAMP